MSSLTITPAAMHKIANVDVDVKYRQPGNVVTYVSIIFEVYKKETSFTPFHLLVKKLKELQIFLPSYLLGYKMKPLYDACGASNRW